MKFRAKAIENIETHTDGIEIGEWVYGYYYFDRANMCGIIVTDLQDESGGVGSGIVQCHVKVDYETLGQYTGLKDKNKKEIYEGDILKSGMDIGVVKYDKKYSGFRVSRRGQGVYLNEFLMGNDSEIIGNNFENPELLKG
jgi:uncharacterized phage protein (TIGR01671 family)